MFDLFVLPFLIGLVILIGILLEKYIRWMKDLTSEEWSRVVKGFFSYRIFLAIKEVFLESLLHRKIFKQNFLLGWMHMSFAFGWFLLIIAGAAESKFYTNGRFEPPYFPIFFKYFVHAKSGFKHSELFVFIMDLLLALILTGLLLALIKRVNSWIFGMKKTTKFNLGNRLTVLSLWLIFPLRLVAESLTSASYNNGGFLTGRLGNLISSGKLGISNINTAGYTAWWCYSIALGVFFVTIPYSRYMHIPTEVVLIFLRKFRIKNKKKFDGFSLIELNSCPRCGLCIDVCQLNKLFDNEKIVPSYYLKSIRDRRVKEKPTFDCLMCGRCKEYCPVGIDTIAQRSLQRAIINQSTVNSQQSTEQRLEIRDWRLEEGLLDFLNKAPSSYEVRSTKYEVGLNQKPEIAYFAGCMTHLTPSIKMAVVEVLKAAGKKFTFIDSEGGACCGRPQVLAGRYDIAEKLMEFNKKAIYNSGAKILLLSCPICYKVFKDDYKLDIEVLHHTEYFSRLVDTAKLNVKKLDKTAVYHDPCELGRGEGVYKQPRNIIKHIANLKKSGYEKGKSLCCGGSVGIFEINNEKRNIIRKDALEALTESKPDYLVTSCPLCKKTFSNGTDTEVKDIAELILSAIIS